MKKCKILIVEDELIVRQAIRYILEGKPDIFEIVAEASNGKEACDILEKTEVDVVISDISMPILDGLELSKNIRMKYPNIYIIILSGYGDFDYVKSCFKYGVFEYILKPKLTPENLYETLNRICMKIGIDSKANDNMNFIESALKNEEKPTLPEKYEAKYLASIGVNLNKIIGYEEERDELYYEYICNKFIDFFKNSSYEFYLTKDNILIALFAFNYKTNSEFISEVKYLMKTLSNEVLGIKFAYSLVSNDEKTVFDNIRNVKTCSKMQFFVHNNEDVFECQEIIKQKVEIFKGFKEKIDFFEEAFEFLHTYISETTYKSGYEEDEFKKQVEYIIYTVFDTYCEEDFFEKNRDIDQFKTMRLFSELYSLDDLLKFVDDIFVTINSRINHLKIGSDSLITKILEFIKSNYYEQLNLKQVADKYHISYSYLSTYFSHNLGIGFNEYLNKIRIENAKYMLKSTELSISDICEKTGYLDQSYFSKIFKKNTGMSPSAYRRDM